MYQVVNVNWSAFLEGILPTLQSRNRNNGTNGGCQLGGGDLGLSPLPLWPPGVAWATEAVGTKFVIKLAKLFENYGSASAMESIALKATMVLHHCFSRSHTNN